MTLTASFWPLRQFSELPLTKKNGPERLSTKRESPSEREVMG